MPTIIKVGEPETMYVELKTTRVWLGPEGELAIEADPDEAWPGYRDHKAEHPHSCDQMGCGQSHVIAWAKLPTLASPGVGEVAELLIENAELRKQRNEAVKGLCKIRDGCLGTPKPWWACVAKVALDRVEGEQE